jgi:hypothetical protein
MGPSDDGQCHAGRDVMGTDDERARALLLARDPGGSLRRFSWVGDDNDLGGRE